MKILSFAVLGIAGVLAASAELHDPYKTIEEICVENGFAFETHMITTQDGYVLTLQRIPGMFQDPSSLKTQKPAVLMMHGMSSDMMEWVMNTADRANAFILARAGYDVWMGNNRGSEFSYGHVTMTKKDKAYWNFYQEDLGTKDVPAFIDFILEATSLDNLSYVGHSQGTTQFLLGASLMPAYFTEKVNVALLLAPVGRTTNIDVEAFQIAANFIPEITFTLVDVLGIYDWMPPMRTATQALELICDVPLVKDVCAWGVSHFLNPDVDEMDRSKVAISFSPAGNAYRNVVYYGQMIQSGRYCLYDYGAVQNHEVYGKTEAPLVPIENYKVPTALFSGSLDRLADPIDVAFLSNLLGENVVFEKEYTLDHMSFAMAHDMSFFSVDAVNVLHQFNPINYVAFLQ